MMGIIERLFPGFSANRRASQVRLECANRELDAVRTFKTQSNFRNTPTSLASANGTLFGAAKPLRAMSRHLSENHDIYVSLIEDLVNNIVGQGLLIEPMPVDRDGNPVDGLKDQLTEQLHVFGLHPEATGELAIGEFWRQVCRMWLIDGEVFLKHHNNNPDYPYASDLHYVVEVLEADFCPMDAFVHDNRIGSVAPQGVVHDQFGRPSHYLFYKTHPGELHTGGLVSTLQCLRHVPANEVTHCKFVRRWPQTRGQPVAHATFSRLQDLNEYEGYELIAAKIGATLAAFIEQDMQRNRPDAAGLSDTDQTPTLAGIPGQVHRLKPGEKVASVKAERPNPELTAFTRTQIQRAAGGIGASASSASRDFSGSYSSTRQEVTSVSVNYKKLSDYFFGKVVTDVYENMAVEAILQGLVDLPPNADPAGLLRKQITGPGMAWIDPLKEAQADILLIQHGLQSRTGVAKRRGIDINTVDRERLDDDFVPDALPLQITTEPDEDEEQ